MATMAQRLNERQMKDRLQLKDETGVAIGDPVKCRALDSSRQPFEEEEDARMTAKRLMDIVVPVGTEVNASDRGTVTKANGYTFDIFVKTPPSKADESAWTFEAWKVD